MSQSDWDRLELEVRDLARRVSQLERHTGLAAETETRPAAINAPAPAAEGTLFLTQTVGLVPVLGRVLLGLAGAYLLRALTEAHILSLQAGVAVGILYAVAWLVWAAHMPATNRVGAGLHSLTAALVISPLLWEATMRFHVLGAPTAGFLLLFFALCAMAVSWRKNLLIVSMIATVAALGTAAALLMATHDVLPFTFMFLAIAAAVEVSACFGHWPNERWLATSTADFSVLLATWLVTNQRGLPEAYAPIPHSWLLVAQVALLAIYLASTIMRTLFRGFAFSGFETAQCAAAFAISVSGGLRLSSEDRGLAPALAILLLTCAAASYMVSFAFLERRGGRGRNFYTYSTFGIVLALTGSRILISGMAAAGVWSALAIACIWVGSAFGRLTLQVHGAIYLLLALISSGAPQEAAAFVLEARQWPGAHPAALWTGVVAAALAYALVARSRPAENETWKLQALRSAMAVAFLWLVVGITAGALTAFYHLCFGADASHASCATLRTGVMVGLALLLAWAGLRWKRSELSWLVYPAMLVGAYRLVAEDLHQRRTVALFLSLLMYGAALTVLPRMRASRTPSTAK